MLKRKVWLTGDIYEVHAVRHTDRKMTFTAHTVQPNVFMNIPLGLFDTLDSRILAIFYKFVSFEATPMTNFPLYES